LERPVDLDGVRLHSITTFHIFESEHSYDLPQEHVPGTLVLVDLAEIFQRPWLEDVDYPESE
jgi:hypothetical protein